MQIRNTLQKKTIYGALCALDHPSATEVYEYVHERNASISRGTVFRVLGNFAREGRAMRLQFCDGDIRYDFRTNPHAHACCRVCGAIRDVPLSPEFVSFGEGADGFFIESAEVDLIGVCAECRGREKENKKRNGGL